MARTDVIELLVGTEIRSPLDVSGNDVNCAIQQTVLFPEENKNVPMNLRKHCVKQFCHITYEEWRYLHVANESIPSIKYEYITVCHIRHGNIILLLCNVSKVTEQSNFA